MQMTDAIIRSSSTSEQIAKRSITMVTKQSESKATQFDMREKITIFVDIVINSSTTLTYITQHAASDYEGWVTALSEIPKIDWDGCIVVQVENDAGSNSFEVPLNHSRYKIADSITEQFYELRWDMYEKLRTHEEVWTK